MICLFEKKRLQCCQLCCQKLAGTTNMCAFKVFTVILFAFHIFAMLGQHFFWDVLHVVLQLDVDRRIFQLNNVNHWLDTFFPFSEKQELIFFCPIVIAALANDEDLPTSVIFGFHLFTKGLKIVHIL